MKLKFDETLSNFAFSFNLRRYAAAVSVSATKSCTADNSTDAGNGTTGDAYRLDITATFNDTAVNFSGAEAYVAVSLTGATLALSHGSNSAFAVDGTLPSYDAVDWSATISAGIDVEVPALGVTLQGTWVGWCRLTVSNRVELVSAYVFSA